MISGIVLLGRESLYEKFVKEYILSFSDDGKSWTMHPQVTHVLNVVNKATSRLRIQRTKG